MGSVTLAQSTASYAVPIEGDLSWETDEAQSRRVSGLPPVGLAHEAQTPRRGDADTPDGARVASAVAADQLAAALTGLSVSHLTPGGHGTRPARLQAPSSHTALMYSPLSTTPLRSSRSRDFLADLSPAIMTPAPAARRALKPRQSTTLEEMLRASLPGMRGGVGEGANKSLLESSLSREAVGAEEEEWWYEEGVSRVMREEILAGGTPVKPSDGGGQARDGLHTGEVVAENVRVRQQVEALAVAQATELARLHAEAAATAIQLARLSTERDALLLAQQHRLARSQRASEASVAGEADASTVDMAETEEAWAARVAVERARGEAVAGWGRAEGLWSRCAEEARGEREELRVGLGVLEVLMGAVGVYGSVLEGTTRGLDGRAAVLTT